MFNSFSQLYARVNPLFLTDFRPGGVAGSVFNSSNPLELFICFFTSLRLRDVNKGHIFDGPSILYESFVAYNSPTLWGCLIGIFSFRCILKNALGFLKITDGPWQYI